MPHDQLGPRGTAVEAFLSELASIKWFSSVGSPVSDPGIERVDFDFVIANHDDPWHPWGPSLPAAERLVWDEIMRQRLLAEQERVQKRVRSGGADFNEFLVDLNRQFDDGYVGDTYLFPHEFVPDPYRLVRGAAYEVLIGTSGFFQDIFQWFKRGYFPVGWRGTWPDGTLLLW